MTTSVNLFVCTVLLIIIFYSSDQVGVGYVT